MKENTTYTVHTCTEFPTAPMGLSPVEVVRHIYTQDGEKFWLEPKMMEIENDDGEVVGEEQDKLNDGCLIWNVFFKDRHGVTKSIYHAYGATEDEAEESYLNECWQDRRWKDDKWIVETDCEFLALEKAND